MWEDRESHEKAAAELKRRKEPGHCRHCESSSASREELLHELLGLLQFYGVDTMVADRAITSTDFAERKDYVFHWRERRAGRDEAIASADRVEYVVRTETP